MVASSAEAKEARIALGEPFFKQKSLFRYAGDVCFTCNDELYATYMTTQAEMIPRIEIYSLNKAFCDLTEVRNCHDRVTSAKRVASSDGVSILIG